MGAHDSTPNFTQCAVEIAADQFCDQRATIFDLQRGHLVCPGHADPDARTRWLGDVRRRMADDPD